MQQILTRILISQAACFFDKALLRFKAAGFRLRTPST